jgi:hypothetical protein
MSLAGRVDESPADGEGSVDCLFFGQRDDGCQCAIAASAVQRVDELSDNGDDQISLETLGFSDSVEERTPRILRVASQGKVVSIALRAAVTTRSVLSNERFPLPRRPFEYSIFSVFISSDVHGRALLVDPERLLNFFLTYSTPVKAQ